MISRTPWMIAFLGVILLAMGCSRPDATPPPQPSPMPLAASDLLLFDFRQAVEANQLGGPTYCEAHNGAKLTCTPSKRFDRALTLSVAGIGGNGYAVWRTDLTGSASNLADFQALRLRVAVTDGALNPHLYLIDADGVRAWVELGKFVHPTEAMQEVMIPLRWFRDGNGRRPDLGRLTEFQIVFEWEEMAGTLHVADIFFDRHVQQTIRVEPVPESVAWPDGFALTPVAGGFTSATTITFGPNGDLWLSQQDGNIWKLVDEDGDGVYDRADLFGSGFELLVGLLWHPSDGTLYASSRGFITALRDEDGDGRADSYTDLVTDLPWGRHHNNGLVWGPDGMIYFGLGSEGDIQEGEPELMATILRMPHLGTNADLEIVARGVRNAYDLAFNARGDLFATENGPDYNDAPDELNHIIPGEHYGYPYAFGDDDGGGKYRTPIWLFEPHASANGIVAYEAEAFPQTYRGNLFVALFGELFGNQRAGHRIDRVILTPKGESYDAKAEPFITGLDRPLDVAVGPDGSLYVMEYVSGAIYRVSWEGGG